MVKNEILFVYIKKDLKFKNFYYFIYNLIKIRLLYNITLGVT